MAQCPNKVRIVLLRNPSKSILYNRSCSSRNCNRVPLTEKTYEVNSVVVIPEANVALAYHIECGTEMSPSRNWYFCSHECLNKHVW
jgi:hypothetical protein